MGTELSKHFVLLQINYIDAGQLNETALFHLKACVHTISVRNLVPKGPFCHGLEISGPLARPNDNPVLNGCVNTIRFVRPDSEHAQSDGKSVNRGLPELDLARGRDPRH